MKRLLNKIEAAEYVGVSVDTLSRLCPVAPVKLGPGPKLQRYDKEKLDAWINSLDAPGAYEDDDAVFARFKGHGKKGKRHKAEGFAAI